MFHTIRTSLLFLVLMTILLGLIYPSFVWLGGVVAFPEQAKGSLITQEGQLIGSHLIGQNFTKDIYFWGRPSATKPFPYNAQNSGSDHLNPAHPDLIKHVKDRLKRLNANAPTGRLVPLDLVTTSASGLDPHISPEGAKYQIQRIAKARNSDALRINKLIEDATEYPTFGFLGHKRVNVLRLNLSLDKLTP